MQAKMEVVAKKISKGTLFKILLIGLGLGIFAMCLLYGTAAVFGAQTVSWQGRQVTGISGLLIALAMWPVFSVIFTVIIWLYTILGLWIYSFFRPFKLVLKGVENNKDEMS